MFEYTKKRHSSGHLVWYDRINIGSIDIIIRENPNVDWDALRADKTLRLSSKERWVCSYSAISCSRHRVGIFETKDAASEALLQHQRSAYEQVSEEGPK